VVNLHGDILAVFDLRVLLGIARAGATDQTRLVVVGDDRDEFGIVADAAQEVVTLRTAELFGGTGPTEGFGRLPLRGTTRDALALFDGEALIRDERLLISTSEEPGA
jgi:chemotaxis signal transduction protein